MSIRQSPIGNGFTIPDAVRVGRSSGICASRENMEATLRRKFLEATFSPVLLAPDFLAFISVSKLNYKLPIYNKSPLQQFDY